MTPHDFASERARRGYGRDKRGPPARRRATSLRNGTRRGYGRDKRGPPARRRATSLRNGSGAGTAATSAALPHDAARLHFGTDAARVRPRQARPSCMTPRGATPPRRRKMRFHCVINLESRRGARRDPFGRNELRSSPGLSWRLQARREAGADTFPVLAHHLPLKIYISVMSLSACHDLHSRVRRGRRATRPTLSKIGIRVNGNGERKVLFPLFVEGVDVVS